MEFKKLSGLLILSLLAAGCSSAPAESSTTKNVEVQEESAPASSEAQGEPSNHTEEDVKADRTFESRVSVIENKVVIDMHSGIAPKVPETKYPSGPQCIWLTLNQVAQHDPSITQLAETSLCYRNNGTKPEDFADTLNINLERMGDATRFYSVAIPKSSLGTQDISDFHQRAQLSIMNGIPVSVLWFEKEGDNQDASYALLCEMTLDDYNFPHSYVVVNPSTGDKREVLATDLANSMERNAALTYIYGVQS